MLQDYDNVVFALEELDSICSEALSFQKSDMKCIQERLKEISQQIQGIWAEEQDPTRQLSNKQAHFLIQQASLKVQKLCSTADRAGTISGDKMGMNTEILRGNSEDEHEDKRRASIESTILKPGKVKFSDIAGLENAKQHLREAIVLPLRFPHLFLGKTKAWTRILLYGPPGTGKTYLARAVSSEIDATFYSVSSSDLLSSWFGESERLIKELFSQAGIQKRSVIFFDEIDSLCRRRDSREDEQVRRIKTELMKQMEGVDSEKTESVFLLCTTNCPDELDSAFVRRFQKRIYIPLPDKTARKKIFELNLVNSSFQLTSAEWETLLEKTEGYSGSDIATCVSDALLEPIREIDRAKHWKWTADGLNITPCADGDPDRVNFSETNLPAEKIRTRPISFNDIYESIQNNQSTVTQMDLQRYENFSLGQRPGSES